jgi:hypothetical protein
LSAYRKAPKFTKEEGKENKKLGFTSATLQNQHNIEQSIPEMDESISSRGDRID